MKRLNAMLCAVAVMGAGMMGLGAGPKVDVKPMQEVATQYDKYAHTNLEGTWEKGDVLPTAKKEDADAWTVDGGKVSVDKDGMLVESNADVGCYVKLAKKTFKGPIGIKYEAMTPVGENPCDLSVQFGPAGKSVVSFAPGGYANSQDFFYIGKERRVLQGGPLITPGQWYTVEVTVAGETVTATVDGKEVGKEKMPFEVTEETEHEVTLYVWNSKGLFKNVQMLKYIPPKADGRTWEQAMGKTTKEDLKAMAVKAGGLLGNDDFGTRESAEEILYLLRPFSVDVVKEALKNSDPEVKIRAERLAGKLGIATEDEKEGEKKADPNADQKGGGDQGNAPAMNVRILKQFGN